MTITVHLYRPEAMDEFGISQLCRSYRARNDPLGSLPALMERLRKDPEARWIGLEAAAAPSTSIHDYEWREVSRRQDIHIVVGSTRVGLPKVVVDQMHDLLHVPQYPDVPPLLSTTALALALHEHFRFVHNRAGVFG